MQSTVLCVTVFWFIETFMRMNLTICCKYPSLFECKLNMVLTSRIFHIEYELNFLEQKESMW